MDRDTYTLIGLENKQSEEDTKKSKARVLKMTKGKQAAWNKLYPTLTIKGLTEEQLSEINNNVY